MKLDVTHPLPAHPLPAQPHVSEPSVGSGRSAPRRLIPGGAFVGSLLLHAVAYAALSASEGLLPAPPSADEIEFSVLTAEPEPEPTQEQVAPPPAAAKPQQIRAVTARVPKAPESAPVVEPAEKTDAPAPPPQVTEALAEAASGLSVAQGSTPGIAGGVVGGTGTAPAPVQVRAPEAPGIDLGALAKGWMGAVNRAIATRALADYPLSARRARVEGRAELLVRIDTAGRIVEVSLAHSSGDARLDDAALAAAKQLGAVEPPPSALHRYLRPVRIPVAFRLM